jgi:hypothetical protein
VVHAQHESYRIQRGQIMSALLQICFVIVTMAVVAIAVATIKVMQDFRKASDEFSGLAVEGRQLIDQLKNVAHDAGEIVGAFREVAPRMRRVVERFESLGERTVRLSDALIHEVEVPVRVAVAMARGVRFGVLQLIVSLTQRFTGRSSTNGGLNYE